MQWYLPRRPVPTANQSVTKLTLTVPEEELRQTLSKLNDHTASMCADSPGVYAEGFVWSLHLEVRGGVLLVCGPGKGGDRCDQNGNPHFSKAWSHL